MTIALYEDFDNPTGTFLDYDTYDPGQRTQLAGQRHVDIRSFSSANAGQSFTMFVLDVLTVDYLDTLTMQTLETGATVDAGEGAAYTMFALDAISMTTMDTMTMSALETAYTAPVGEAWTVGTIGPQSDRNYFNGISITCATGTTTSESDGPTVLDLSSFTAPDYISLALPAFPLADLTLASTFLDVTSGDFETGPTDSLPFSASTTTLVAGDCEARFPLSLLVNVDRSQIRAIRFRIQATAACTFRCLAIRCLAATWKYAPIDQNTLYGYLGATVPPTGAASSYTFPVAASPVTPTDWPIMMFSDGGDGPLLVDITVGAVINTGSNSAANALSLYFREVPERSSDVGDLDSSTMADLELPGYQPDYNPGTLDNFAETRAIIATVKWGSSGSIEIKDLTSGDPDYVFTGMSLTAHSSYYVLATLVDDSLRVQLYPIDEFGAIDFTTVVFDTTAVIDNNFIRRRRGRFGWYAQLQEGDTSVRALRPSKVVYGEYRSAALASITPVDGARLYVSATPDTQLYSGAGATTGVVIAPDVTKSRSGHCIRVACSGTVPLQGLLTAPVRLENLSETEIEFDVLAPAGTKLTALLQDDQGRLILLYLPPFPANRWSHMKIPLSQIATQTTPGAHSLYLVQAETGQNTWYIDNPSIHAKAVSWQGRGHAGDLRHVDDPDWIEFGDAINDPYNAAMLGRGSTLQVRGQVLSPDADITGVQILPKYAELGAFVWSDQAPIYPAVPSPSFTSDIPSVYEPDLVVFDGSASTAPAGIMSYYWTFGDGSYSYGDPVTHTYASPGTYLVNLTVIDVLDQKASTTHSVTVE